MDVAAVKAPASLTPVPSTGAGNDPAVDVADERLDAPPAPSEPAAGVAQQEDKERVVIEQRTLRYRVDGKQIRVDILDEEGRIIRSIPAEALAAMRRRELQSPSLSIRS